MCEQKNVQLKIDQWTMEARLVLQNYFALELWPFGHYN